ncbi:putative protein kinase [Trypanosoma conorhini]|uniref:Protein kinase domain-containing protein n=1 Tax=Trypanosoma conorhini TaxID=83891 RepID=A0A3R7NNL1_9TRYP|nr:putative protein kinase [Trypanosoma conorhini]RNF20990.1 putative protein kinase [Trypanosoma conorhini]
MGPGSRGDAFAIGGSLELEAAGTLMLDEKSGTGIIASLPQATYPMFFSYAIGLHDRAASAGKSLPSSRNESLGDLSVTSRSAEHSLTAVDSKQRAKCALYPISMIFSDHTCEVWLCYSSWLKAQLVCVGYFHVQKFSFTDHTNNYVRATRSVNTKNGISKCFGMSASWEDGVFHLTWNAMRSEEKFDVIKGFKRGIAVLAAQLRHSFLPRIEISHGCPNVLLTEFVPGSTLTELMARATLHLPAFVTSRWGTETKRPLKISLIRHILSGVLHALLDLHACGVGHGSLRPDLVVVTPDLNVSILTALFFAMSEDAEWLRWCSPDVALSGVQDDVCGAQKQADDIWAFGCLAFFLATDKVPFHDKFDVTAVMSELKLLRFAAEADRRGLRNPDGSMRGRQRGHFLEVDKISNGSLRDLIEQCTRLLWAERPDIFSLRKHPFFTEGADESRGFCQDDVRTFLERARSLASAGEATVKEFVCQDALKQRTVQEAEVENFAEEELSALLLSYSVKDILLWRIALGLQHRHFTIGLGANFANHAILPPVDFPAELGLQPCSVLDIPFGLSKVATEAVRAALQTSKDFHTVVSAFVNSAQNDEELLCALVEFACVASASEESQCSCSKPPSPAAKTNPLNANLESEMEHCLPIEIEEKKEDVHQVSLFFLCPRTGPQGRNLRRRCRPCPETVLGRKVSCVRQRGGWFQMDPAR